MNPSVTDSNMGMCRNESVTTQGLIKGYIRFVVYSPAVHNLYYILEIDNRPVY